MEAYQYDDYAEEFKKRAPGHWAAAVAYARKDGPPPVRPYQVEIHPRSQGRLCWMRCVDCHGQFQRSSEGVEPRRWLTLLGDLEAMGVPSVVYSGAYTDPAADEDLICSLLRQGAKRWGVKLHTCGLALTDKVIDSVVYASLQGPLDSYINLSKVAADERVFGRMCWPSGTLDRENRWLLKLFRAAEDSKAPLVIRLNCRLTRFNGHPEHLMRLMSWLAGASDTVTIRFTTDYLPTLAPRSYQEWFDRDLYLPYPEASEAVGLALDRSKFPKDRVSLRDAGSSRYSGVRCYNGLLLSAVSAGGLVFPCQGITSPCFAPMAYGDLSRESFSAAWLRYVSGWHEIDQEVYNCPRCVGACEGQINSALAKEAEGL